MKSPRFILPILSFVITSIACTSYLAYSRSQISRLINNAGKRGEPVIAVSSAIMDYRSVSLYSLDNSSVRLILPRDYADYSNLDISEDGFIFLSRQYVYTLPDPRPLPLRLSKLVTRSRTDRFTAGPGKFIVRFWEGKMTLMDTQTGERTEIKTPPFPITQWLDPGSVTEAEFPVASDNGKCVVIAELDETPGANDIIWRYNVSDGEWANLGKYDFIKLGEILVSPNGQLISVPFNPPTMMFACAFIESDTGSILHIVQDSQCVYLSDKWAVVITGVTQQSQDMEVYNIEDNWKKYTITLRPRAIPRLYHFLVFYEAAVYEPPPNGLDGMYENYR